MEGEDDPLLARGHVSEYPDQQEGETVVVDCSLPVLPHAHTPAALQATSQQLRDWQQTDPTLQKIRELASGDPVEERQVVT